MPSIARSQPHVWKLVATATLVLGCSTSDPAPSSPPLGGTAGSGMASGGSSSGAPGGGGMTSKGGSETSGDVGGAAGSGVPAAGAGGSAAGATNGGNAASGAGAGGGAVHDYCHARDGLELCETFEARAPGAAEAKPPWAPAINGDGQVTIDDTVAHGGGHSLKVRGSGFSTFLVLSGEPLVSAAGRFYVRLFMRTAEALTGGHNTFLIADTAAAPGAGNAFRLGEMNAMLMYTVNGDTHGALANESYYTDHLPGAALQPLAWGCLELLLDHTKPEIRVSLDGNEIVDLHHTDWALDSYDTLRFGFEKYAGPVSDVWYDDIAVGTAPIGCD